MSSFETVNVHRRGPAATIELNRPEVMNAWNKQFGVDLLAAVGDFVPALAPYAERLGERLLTAGDVPALAPRLSAMLRGDEVVVLKASRGVALERILPALTARAKSATPAASAPPA